MNYVWFTLIHLVHASVNNSYNMVAINSSTCLTFCRLTNSDANTLDYKLVVPRNISSDWYVLYFKTVLKSNLQVDCLAITARLWSGWLLDFNFYSNISQKFHRGSNQFSRHDNSQDKQLSDSNLRFKLPQPVRFWSSKTDHNSSTGEENLYVQFSVTRKS